MSKSTARYARNFFIPAIMLMSGLSPVNSAELGWLAVCNKCASPTIFSKTGIDTDHAVAEARMTRAEIAGWCANWSPEDKGCVKRELSAQDMQKIYRATANCLTGQITPIDGRTYTLAGVWDNSDIGGGRSKWRDASGHIVGRDNASGGLGISQQWEELCPNAGKKAPNPLAAKTGKPANHSVQKLPAAEFAVGQRVLAKYGNEWVGGIVNKIHYRNGPKGTQIDYDVSLENHKRGIVPARMLRAK